MDDVPCLNSLHAHEPADADHRHRSSNVQPDRRRRLSDSCGQMLERFQLAPCAAAHRSAVAVPALGWLLRCAAAIHGPAALFSALTPVLMAYTLQRLARTDLQAALTYEARVRASHAAPWSATWRFGCGPAPCRARAASNSRRPRQC